MRIVLRGRGSTEFNSLMYRWRCLNNEERERTLAWRQQRQRPLHSPKHLNHGQRHYLISAACYEHAFHIGYSVERMNQFAAALLDQFDRNGHGVAGWVVLPNHYHVLISCSNVHAVLKMIGQLHGRTSFQWNGEENTRGRKVWYNAAETVMKSVEHHYATLNYIHHNAVKHGYVPKWEDWPWSSASEYLGELGRDEARRLWLSYPIDQYGEGWDDAAM